MFVGRSQELDTLNRLYAKRGFQMVVLYGRRRVGKTTLIDEFAKDKPTLYFTAKQQSDVLNLRELSRKIIAFFDLPASTPLFGTWSDALDYIAQHAMSHPRYTEAGPMVFVFDEFPYAAAMNRSLPSVMQIAIDHGFKDTDATMILSGSNEGFMESEVLSEKSPLYGRRTAQIKLQPFDYADAALMLPSTPPERAVEYYATFGGTPYYLEQIDESISYRDNLLELCFSPSGLLFNEPMMLLREELREPALYNSILQAIANGASSLKTIAEHSGVEYTSVGKYTRTLEELGLAARIVPFGDMPSKSRKGRYVIRDPFFAYWYRFVNENTESIETGAGHAAAQDAAFTDAFDTYVGQQFETVCLQWLIRANREGQLPFLATRFGKWWGTDPYAHEQTDIDVIAANPRHRALLAGECKWRNSLNVTATVDTLRSRAQILPGYDERHLALFVKTEELARVARQRYGDALLVRSVTELFDR